jgi:hypothetical protein
LQVSIAIRGNRVCPETTLTGIAILPAWLETSQRSAGPAAGADPAEDAKVFLRPEGEHRRVGPVHDGEHPVADMAVLGPADLELSFTGRVMASF